MGHLQIGDLLQQGADGFAADGTVFGDNFFDALFKRSVVKQLRCQSFFGT